MPMQSPAERAQAQRAAAMASREYECRKAHQWLLIADFMGQTLSKDPSTKIGCIILGPHWEVRSTGYNGFPRGVDEAPSERHERPEKYEWTAHGEENAIAQAARMGTAIDGCVMVVAGGLLPCDRCARAIINSGIKCVYAMKPDDPERESRWAKENERAIQMFHEAGVGLVVIDRTGTNRRYYSNPLRKHVQ